MGKVVTVLTALTLAMGTAAYAGTPVSVNRAAPVSTQGQSQQASSLTYSNTSSLFDAGAGNPDVPGATGRTIVPGTSSTIAGDSMATNMERTGALSGE